MQLRPNVELMADKPEIYYPFDGQQAEELARLPGLVIGEMAGRDSVAAILAALASDEVQTVLPIAVYTATEYGDWHGFERNATFLRQEAERRYGKRVLDLAWMGSPRLWQALNGRYISEIVQQFGRYSPCLACHFYLHVVRLPLALQLGVRVVIGGDREQHDERAKINQIAPAMDAYRRFMARFGLELREPLRSVANTSALDSILGAAWPGGSPQPQCVFSGNYYALDGGSLWTAESVERYVEDFVYPVLEEVIAQTVAGQPADYNTVVRDRLVLLRQCRSSA